MPSRVSTRPEVPCQISLKASNGKIISLLKWAKRTSRGRMLRSAIHSKDNLTSASMTTILWSKTWCFRLRRIRGRSRWKSITSWNRSVLSMTEITSCVSNMRLCKPRNANLRKATLNLTINWWHLTKKMPLLLRDRKRFVLIQTMFQLTSSGTCQSVNHTETICLQSVFLP